ncbi:MAG TPA: o-succinylbenzoate synthase [Pyrinomonadaceae bacterium]|nr:o-succinylbenzoate synthase [Pyrinomonadaceae bacterium]
MSSSSSVAHQSVSLESIVLHRVRIPFVEPFRISNGVVAEKESILIEATSDDGVVGWGECSPMSGSFYSADTPDSSWQVLLELIPRLFELGAMKPNDVYQQLREFPGNAFAKAGVEGALWDVYSRRRGLSLCEVLGIDRRAVRSGVAIGIFGTVEELIERIHLYVGQGYQRVKIKIEPGWDVEPVSAVREQFPDVALMVDANAAYSLTDEALFTELDRFELIMIEQPLAADAIDEAGELQARLNTPLCADESAESLTMLDRLIEKRAARIINVKVQRVGGLSEALLMLETARATGLQCWIGTMPELGIASAQGLHLAMHSGFSFPTDIEASTRWYVDDVIEPCIEISQQGFIHVPDDIGSGYKVSRAKVEQYTTAVERFE